MIVVMQCAARKTLGSGYFHDQAGRRVCFVAQPGRASGEHLIYARPDEPSDAGPSWRAELLSYNQERPGNPFGLATALELYDRPIYQRLAARFGRRKIFILSAGWGLIEPDFLTPMYNITFDSRADPLARRRKSDSYDDFCMLPEDTKESVVFLGGADYLPLFARLTKKINTHRAAFYNSPEPPAIPGLEMARFSASTRFNWHYECAEALLSGRLKVSTYA